MVFIEESGIYREELAGALVLIWDSEILLAEWYSLRRIYDVYYEVYLIGTYSFIETTSSNFRVARDLSKA